MTTPTLPVPTLLRAFRFAVRLTPSPGTAATGPLADGAFSECSGLTLDAEVKDHLEGGRNDAMVRLPGRVKLQPIVLKRGMFVAPGNTSADTQLWDWFAATTAAGTRPRRYEGLVVVHRTSDLTPLATWKFTRGLPLKVVGPTLNAQTGELAVEELHIAHEGLTLSPPGGTSGGPS